MRRGKYPNRLRDLRAAQRWLLFARYGWAVQGEDATDLASWRRRRDKQCLQRWTRVEGLPRIPFLAALSAPDTGHFQETRHGRGIRRDVFPSLQLEYLR